MQENQTVVVLSMNLSSEDKSTRADYMTAGSVQLYLSDDKSTHVNSSPGAKHLLIGCTHSAQKCIVARLIKLKCLIRTEMVISRFGSLCMLTHCLLS